ncbi:hypothetical protein MPH_13813 [Macrophomina phaseolina MS6]|uniref:Uncharacterized protein n=1 Tax=Macrophomina phaseolina (strain MS6) TaxID=1126212 RepID=K2RXN0_MACPH|nr:hypothetical protein MPH_13813 [Macrophomina phaseolina MS6]
MEHNEELIEQNNTLFEQGARNEDEIKRLSSALEMSEETCQDGGAHGEDGEADGSARRDDPEEPDLSCRSTRPTQALSRTCLPHHQRPRTPAQRRCQPCRCAPRLRTRCCHCHRSQRPSLICPRPTLTPQSRETYACAFKERWRIKKRPRTSSAVT